MLKSENKQYFKDKYPFLSRILYEIENREDLEPEVKKTMGEISERALRPLIKEKDPEIK